MISLKMEDRARYVEVMALAICNAIRRHHGLKRLRNLNDVENPELYRKQAAASLDAYLAERFGH